MANELTTREIESIQQILSPILDALMQTVANTNEALERIAVTQKIQADRMDALEKEIRLQTPVTPVQVKYISSAIRSHAVELLTDWANDETAFHPESDKKKVNRVSTLIRKSILTDYGVGTVSEIPKCEYAVVLDSVKSWNDVRTVRNIAKGVKP